MKQILKNCNQVLKWKEDIRPLHTSNILQLIPPQPSTVPKGCNDGASVGNSGGLALAWTILRNAALLKRAANDRLLTRYDREFGYILDEDAFHFEGRGSLFLNMFFKASRRRMIRMKNIKEVIKPIEKKWGNCWFQLRNGPLWPACFCMATDEDMP